MYKGIRFSLVIMLITVAVVKIPFEIVFGSFVTGDNLRFLNAATRGIILLVFGMYVAKRYQLFEVGGFIKPIARNYWMLFLPFLFPGIMPISELFSSGFYYRESLVVMFFIYLLWGLVEEVICRGVIQGYLLLKNPSVPYWKISVLSSFAFGVLHLSNITHLGLGGALSQVVFAFFMGMLFSAILLRLKNIWLLGVCHGLYNFLVELTSDGKTEAVQGGNFWGLLLSLLGLCIIYSPTLLMYALLIGKKKQELKESSL